MQQIGAVNNTTLYKYKGTFFCKEKDNGKEIHLGSCLIPTQSSHDLEDNG